MNNIVWVNIDLINLNPENPRNITDVQFQKLKKSIKDFPQMLEMRPLIVDENRTVLGGNMRLQALKDLGYTEVPVMNVNNLTEEQKKEFVIKDNLSYGEWDWDILENNWDVSTLNEWGLEPIEGDIIEDQTNPDDNPYTKKVQAPIYTPSEDQPKPEDTYDDKFYKQLIELIDSSSVDPEMKSLLKLYAVRHIRFNYEKIADLYAHADTETQELMETSALVIIDYDRAIELGYVKLGDELNKQFLEEQDDEA